MSQNRFHSCKKILRAATAAAILGCLASVSPAFAANPTIVPVPRSIVVQEGSFRITPSTAIIYGKGLKPQADILRDLRTSEGTKGQQNILLAVDPKKVEAEEGYILAVTPKGITVTGHDAGGVFYGIQSLLQLMPAGGSPMRPPVPGEV